jgi:hypothetical protein
MIEMGGRVALVLGKRLDLLWAEMGVPEREQVAALLAECGWTVPRKYRPQAPPT